MQFAADVAAAAATQCSKDYGALGAHLEVMTFVESA
jgi:hypothetical protein